MPARKKVLAIVGSTRKSSTNLNLVHAISKLASPLFDLTVFEGLSDLPHFNPDNDLDNPPDEVLRFREQLKTADGILICTPEYAMGVPGTLKNAIDWTVSSSSFSQKPTALITASLNGEKGHASLMDTLKVIEAGVTEATQLIISYASTKVSKEPQITDEATAASINRLIEAFNELMTHE